MSDQPYGGLYVTAIVYEVVCLCSPSTRCGEEPLWFQRLQRSPMWSSLLSSSRCESAGGVPVARVIYELALRCAELAVLLLCETLLPDEASEHQL